MKSNKCIKRYTRFPRIEGGIVVNAIHGIREEARKKLKGHCRVCPICNWGGLCWGGPRDGWDRPGRDLPEKC